MCHLKRNPKTRTRQKRNTGRKKMILFYRRCWNWVPKTFLHMNAPSSKISEYHTEGVRRDLLNFFRNSLTEYILIRYGLFKNFIFPLSPQEIVQEGQIWTRGAKTRGNEPITKEPAQHCHQLPRCVWPHTVLLEYAIPFMLFE